MSLQPLQFHIEFGQTVLLTDNGITQLGELGIILWEPVGSQDCVRAVQEQGQAAG